MKYTTFQKAFRAAQKLAAKNEQEYFILEWHSDAFYVIDWAEYEYSPVDAIASVNELGELDCD